MEPRELWDRNSVLAEAFCATDEQVRQAQTVLDEAQAERSRTLAAFAVTVGNDGAVADLMGLSEREVRLARRTVGKSDARSVAEELLDRPSGIHTQPIPQAVQAPAPVPQQVLPPVAPADDPYGDPHAAMYQQQAHGGGVQGDLHLPHPRAESAPLGETGPHPDTLSAPLHPAEAENNAVVWSSSMDSVLLWSWQSGLDLQTVAGELGLDIRALLMRVQALADNGMLTPSSSQTSEANRAGRHRRHHEEAYAALFSPTATFPQVHY
ncbi:hypothetical protein OG875_10540 [Streptomyces sp. NBC_01498]|uniref:hypothetical protein n=1 Tax=Streptomyces sp. NBC_01498 TaxID=2975870 RepID=UPI002E7BB0BF|nr:hypothetical protein [Streptomyces sp. NBC_01498]WTL24996.1 hypothetical protein OG875_10540 [Streptomyces sp. NBC_01498]